MNDLEKIQESVSAFQQFVDQFGENDEVKEMFLDLLLESIYGNNIPVSVEAGQERNEINSSIRTREMPTYTID